MRHKKLYIVIICITVFVLSLILGNLGFETNDDALLNLIAAGAYGEPSQYMIYTNIILGYVFKIMYHLIPGVNWYLWIYLIFNFLSILIISLIVTEYSNTAFSVFVTIAINFLMYKDYYITLQYTKNATLYVVTGGILAFALICSISKNHDGQISRKRIVGTILASSFFMSLGMCARKESFILAIPFVLILIMLYWIFGMREIQIKIRLKYLAVILIPVASALVCLAIHTYKINSDPDWAYFTKWNEIMTDKRDYGNYNLQWNYDEYIANGFTEIDFEKMMAEWMWNDTDYFTLEYLEKMREIGKDNRVNELRLSPDIFASEFKEIAETFQKSLLPWALLVIAVLGIVISRKNALYIFGQLILLLGEYYYLATTRRFEWRVESGIWYCAILMCLAVVLIQLTGKKNSKNPFVWIVSYAALSACLVVLMLSHLYTDFTQIKQNRIVKEPDPVFYTAQSLKELDDYFFVTAIDEMYGGLCGAKNIFDTDSSYADLFDNSVSIGGWMIPSPIGNYHAYQRGISNPIKALFERDDVYYLGGGEHMGYLFVYIEEKYGPGLSVEQVEFENGVTAWKFHYE